MHTRRPEHRRHALNSFTVVRFALALVAVFAASCASSSLSAAGADDSHKLDGVWRSLGYGLALEVEGDHFALYETTSISRLKVEEGDLAALAKLAGTVRLDDDAGRFSVLDPSSIAPIVFERIERLPGPKEVDDAADSDARHAFDIVWQTFHDHYAFFELRQVDWDAGRETWRAKLKADSSDAELFDALAGMLASLGDNHVEITAEGFDFAPPSGVPDFPLVRQWRQEHEATSSDVAFFDYVRGKYIEHVAASAESIAKQMTGDVGRGANDMLMWGLLPGDVGYLNVRAMAGYASDDDAKETVQLAALDAALDRAMSDLADARAMIVDVRFNGGGWDSAGVRIANRFADKRRAAFSKKARTAEGFTPPYTVYVEPAGPRQFTRPTLLLTSPMTASAAEIFTFCMKVLPHVTQAGLPTMGIHSDMLVRHLPNGWTFSLSNEVYQFVDGKVYEKVGIGPDIKLSMFDTGDLTDGKDQVIRRAIEILSQPTGNE